MLEGGDRITGVTWQMLEPRQANSSEGGARGELQLIRKHKRGRENEMSCLSPSIGQTQQEASLLALGAPL